MDFSIFSAVEGNRLTPPLAADCNTWIQGGTLGLMVTVALRFGTRGFYFQFSHCSFRQIPSVCVCLLHVKKWEMGTLPPGTK